jgi:uncharacterized protein
MGFRTLFVLIAIALVIWAGKRLWDGRRVLPPRGRHLPQAMLRCDHCGLHVPADEAIRHQAGVYCCPEHRRAADPDGGSDS